MNLPKMMLTVATAVAAMYLTMAPRTALANDVSNPNNNNTNNNYAAVRLSKILGHTIKGEEGKDLGKLEDLVIDKGVGRVAYGVVAYGGWLGMGDKLFAVPWSAFKLTRVPEHKIDVTLPISREIIKNARGFDKSHWPEMADRAWWEENNKTYNQTPYWNDKRYENSDYNARDESERKADIRSRRASNLIGCKVRNDAGEAVGKIEDLILTDTNGSVAYAVLDCGAWYNLAASPLVAVPFGSLHFNADRSHLILNDTKEHLRHRAFKSDEWPNFDDQKWRDQISQEYPDMGPGEKR